MSTAVSPPHADHRRRPAPVIVVAEGHACAVLDRLEDLYADRQDAAGASSADGAALVAAAFGAAPADGPPAPARRPPRAVRRVPRSRRSRRPAHEILGACREVVDACVHLDAPDPAAPVADVPAPPVPVLVPGAAAGARRRRRGPRVRALALGTPTRALHLLLCLAGLAAGIAWGLPLEAVGDRCPPRGEGYGQCYLQKSVLPAVVLALGGLVAGHLVAVLTTEAMPRWWHRWRAGERPTRMTRRQADPPYETDPLLLAASWGVRTGRDAD